MHDPLGCVSLFHVGARLSAVGAVGTRQDLKQWDVIRASRSSITRCVEDICRVVIPGKYAFGMSSPSSPLSPPPPQFVRVIPAADAR